jgi:hypothetical protein
MFDSNQGGAFRGFHHLGYVTSDLSRALDLLKQQYGLQRITENGEIPVALVGGKQYLHKTAMCFVGPWGLEVIEPTGGHDDVYRNALPRDRFGLVLHHVCYSAPTLQELYAAKAGFVAAESEIVLDSTSSTFFYADTRKDFGHYTEWAYIGPWETEFLERIARY